MGVGGGCRGRRKRSFLINRASMTVKRVGSISWVARGLTGDASAFPRGVAAQYFTRNTPPLTTYRSMDYGNFRFVVDAEGGRDGNFEVERLIDQNASTTCIIWPSTSFASFSLRLPPMCARTNRRHNCILLPFSSLSLISSRDSSSRENLEAKLGNFGRGEKELSLESTLIVDRLYYRVAIKLRVIEENRTGFERGRNRVYISFRSFLSRMIRRYPRRIDIRVHPVLM